MSERQTARRRTVKLTFAYDGTNYVGWQWQANGPSIQAELERAIHAVTGETLRVAGAGRTDAGVHARAQTASFVTATRVPTWKLPLALSAHLPEDIVVSDAEEMPDGFHARKSARGKVYRYSIYTGRVRPVIERRYTTHFTRELDVEAMSNAAARLVGTFDFSAFVTELRAMKKGDCVRTIRGLDVWRDEPIVHLQVEGNGFLYNMVRTIAGCLVEVGKGNYPPKWMADVLESRDRRRAGPVLPARGLCLMRVLY